MKKDGSFRFKAMEALGAAMGVSGAVMAVRLELKT